MITQPSTSRLIEVIRGQLADVVAPNVTDPAAAGALHMIDRVLQTLEVRAENEIAWMIEAIGEIQLVATEVVPGLPDPAGASAALARLEPGDSLKLSDVSADFDRAGRLLSELLEATVGLDGAARERVLGLLDRRLERELAVQGADFALVGRG
jgi:hypothetical protein